MNKVESQGKRDLIIKATWDYLLLTGLSEASIGDLCKSTRLSQSSLYYWFKNKEELWISAGRYGLSAVVEALFEYTLSCVGNPNEYFKNLLDVVEKHKNQIRLAVEITANPTYGPRMREKSSELNEGYYRFSDKLSKYFGCSHHQAEVFVYSVLSSIVDFVVWDDREKTQLVLDDLRDRTIELLSKKVR